MNFKPTWLKIILSIILGLITGVYTAGIGFGKVFSTEQLIFGFVIVFLATYVIYSLIQKKK